MYLLITFTVTIIYIVTVTILLFSNKIEKWNENREDPSNFLEMVYEDKFCGIFMILLTSIIMLLAWPIMIFILLGIIIGKKG